MKLPLYFISDCHIGMKINSDETERREKLFSVFNKIKESGGTLIIGGDFFDFWFNFKNYNPPCYRDVIKQLVNLKDNSFYKNKYDEFKDKEWEKVIANFYFPPDSSVHKKLEEFSTKVFPPLKLVESVSA